MKFFFIYQIILNIFFVFYFEKISKILNLFDLPDNKRKLHKKKTPSIGGCLIFINIFSFFFYHLVKNIFFDFNFDLDFFDRQEFVIFILFSFSFFFIGILDDKIYLNANIKLALYFFIILTLALLNDKILINFINFTFVSYNLNDLFISIFFTIICFLLFINAFNMYDGINLQSGLYGLISLIYLIFLNPNEVFYYVIIIGLLFFLFLNYKNKTFLGDGGSYLISFILGCGFIKNYNTSNIIYADQIFLIMLFPGLDLLRLSIIRILNKRHPFSPDRLHVHHLLLEKFKYNKTILIIFFLMLFSGTLSVNSLYNYLYVIIFILIYLYLIFFLTVKKKK